MTADDPLFLQSKKLLDLIKTKLKEKKSLFFDEYMHMALYTPELGYYASKTTTIGAKGDFTTAPELTPLFAECFANAFIDVLDEVLNADILEFGAGTGQFALELLKTLNEKNKLPCHYYILEVNAYLKTEQQAKLKANLPSYLFEKIIWINKLPEKGTFNGIMFANEVIDAMPVTRFIKKNDEIKELGVILDHDALTLAEITPRKAVTDAVFEIENKVGKLAQGYTSEINLWIDHWIKALAESLNSGAIFLVDYGYDRGEFYRYDRTMGTLQCYFRHQSHDDALWYPGIQDITSHVDFTQVAKAGINSGLELSGYTTQAAFLLDCQLDEVYKRYYEQSQAKLKLELASQMKTLLMPGAMGEVFKVIAFERHLVADVKGFEFQNLSFRL